MAVCKTTNGGRTWGTRRRLGSEGGYGSGCRDIAVAPSNNSIVYAGGQLDYRVKMARSEDAGNSWTDVTENLESLHRDWDLVNAIWVSPTNPYSLVVGTNRGVFRTIERRDPKNFQWSETTLTYSTRAFAYDKENRILYAATDREGVFYSNDSGSTWRELNDGLDFKRTLCIGLDSENDLLFLGTDGGSVWRLNLGETNTTYLELNSQ